MGSLGMESHGMDDPLVGSHLARAADSMASWGWPLHGQKGRGLISASSDAIIPATLFQNVIGREGTLEVTI